MVEAIVSAFDHPHDPLREVRGVGRRDELVVLDLQHIPLHSQAQHGPHEVVSPSVDARGSYYIPAVSELPDVLLPGKLSAAVDADWVRRIEGLVGSSRLAVEDVVRADVQEIIASLLTDLGQVPWTERVDPVSKVGLCLAAVDVGVGGRVHDDIWGVLLQRQPHGTEVRHVKLSLRERHDLVAAPGEEFGELETELAARAAYEDLRHVVLPRPSPAVRRT